MDLYTCLLKQGGFADVEDLQCSVLPVVFWVTVVPFGLIHQPWDFEWLLQDFAWSPRPRAIASHFIFLPFSKNCTNSCHLLTKLLAGLVAYSSRMQVYCIVPLVFPLLVERLELKKLFWWTGLMYKHSKLRPGVSPVYWMIDLLWFVCHVGTQKSVGPRILTGL